MEKDNDEMTNSRVEEINPEEEDIDQGDEQIEEEEEELFIHSEFLHPNPEFTFAQEELTALIKSFNSFDTIARINNFLSKFLEDIPNNEELQKTFIALEHHMGKLENGQFDWLYDSRILPQIIHVFDFCDSFIDQSHFEFVDFSGLRGILPLDYFLNYFNWPFIAKENDESIYNEVLVFQSVLLSSFNKLYIKSFLASLPTLKAKDLATFDPFMRNSIREFNMKYYEDNFWDNERFDMYSFIIDLFEKYVLNGVPNWNLERGKPFPIHILELVRTLFDHGLISFDFCKVLFNNLYLACETLKGLEIIFSNRRGEEEEVMERCRLWFVECREIVSEILIHIFTLFNDVAFEISLTRIYERDRNIVYFEDFLYNDKASFNYFCSIMVKYLTNGIDIGERTVESDRLNNDLTVIFNFLGDFQNDSFSQSLDLVKEEYYTEYTKGYKEESGEFKPLANSILQRCMEFIKNSMKNRTQDFIKEEITELIEFINGELNLTDEGNSLKNSIGLKLELSCNNFVGVWVSILTMLGPDIVETDTIIDGLIILKCVLKGNYPGQAILLTGTVFENFKEIISVYQIYSLVLLKEVFESDSFVLYNTKEVFVYFLHIYERNFQELLSQLHDKSLRRLKNDMSFKNSIGVLFFFNNYFDEILQKHLIKDRVRKRYDLLLSRRLKTFVFNDVLPILLNNRFLDDFSEFEIISDIFKHGLENKGNIEIYLRTTNIKEMLYQFFYTTFKLFNKATYEIYTSDIYEEVIKIDLGREIRTLESGYKQSIVLRLEFVKLFERFFVFFPDHLIDNRLIFNSAKDRDKEIYTKEGTPVLIGENFMLDNYDQIYEFVSNELYWFRNFYEQTINIDTPFLKRVHRYLLKGPFLIIYKFVRGMKIHLTQLEDDKILSDLKTILGNIAGELSRISPVIDRIISAFETNQYSFEKKEADLTVNFEDVTRNFNYTEELSNQDLKHIRERVYSIVDKLNIFYERSQNKFLIEKYNKKITEKRKEKKKETLYQEKNVQRKQNMGSLKMILNKRLNRVFNKDYHSKFKLLKGKYTLVKTSFQESQESNQFFVVLSNNKESKKNINNIIFFIIKQFQKLRYDLTDKDETHFYLHNEFFFSSVIILNNLISWQDDVRAYFYDVVIKLDHEARQNLFNNIWGTFISLYHVVVFKTFRDQQWNLFWSLFYILSNFIQNFNDDSNLLFKNFFNNTRLLKGAYSQFTKEKFQQREMSVFFENNAMLDNLGAYTNLSFNTDAIIVPSDREELFPIFVRLFSMNAQYLTGPCLKNQRDIYKSGIYFWEGIIVRVIDNIDSNFYEVKLACLTYIDALMDGIDEKIVFFIASNFSVIELFTVINRLTKKLFVRRKIMSRDSIAPQQKKRPKIYNVRKNIKRFNTLHNRQVVDESSIITLEQENKYTIKSYKELMRMYQKYRDSFSNHIILEIITQIYIMIVYMSFKIKFYQFFLKEKEDGIDNYLQNKGVIDIDRNEEHEIYQFLKTISSNIEMTITKGKKSSLKRINFIIPPECFFMTRQMMDELIEVMDIETTNAKHIYILDSIEGMHIEMISNKRNFEKYGKLFIFTTNDFFKRMTIVIYIISVLLNFIMLFYMIVDSANSTLTSNRSEGDIFLSIVAILLMVFSAFIGLLWLRVKYFLEIKIEKTNIINSGRPYTTKMQLKVIFFNSLFGHVYFSSFFLAFAFTAIGFFLSDPFFYTLNLFLITNQFKTVNYIRKSITKHYGKLALVFMITVFVILSYTFILFFAFTGSINDDFTEVCKTFSTCFLNSINHGLRLGGGISDVLDLVGKTNNLNAFYGRFFFDITFFILIKLIFLNLIAGIIIDTFSDLRDEITFRNFQLKNICTICGISRSQLEKEGETFDNHISNVHNAWEYVFFIIRLRGIKRSTFNGIEQYVFGKTELDDTSWIPQGVYLKQGQNSKKID